MHILVDADACPVKDEVYRVAACYGIERVVVGAASDAADDWIAERADPPRW